MMDRPDREDLLKIIARIWGEDYDSFDKDALESAMYWVYEIEALFPDEEEIREQERWEVGEELCILIGNKMLEDTKTGELLGEQLRDYMNNYLKVGGSRQALKEEK